MLVGFMVQYAIADILLPQSVILGFCPVVCWLVADTCAAISVSGKQGGGQSDVARPEDH